MLVHEELPVLTKGDLLCQFIQVFDDTKQVEVLAGNRIERAGLDVDKRYGFIELNNGGRIDLELDVGNMQVRVKRK
jgi:hypothetical protein